MPKPFASLEDRLRVGMPPAKSKNPLTDVRGFDKRLAEVGLRFTVVQGMHSIAQLYGLLALQRKTGPAISSCELQFKLL